MKSLILCFASTLIASMLVSHADTGQETVNAAKSPAQMENELGLVKEHLALREQRADAILEDILDLDKEIDAQIETITKKLAAMKDSDDSGITVLQTKEKVIQGLQRLIAYYNQERSRMQKELQKTNPEAQREDLSQVAGAYDKKIETRVDQIIALTQSLEKHKDLPKYTEKTGYWGNTYKEKNKDYKKQTQVENRTTATRKELLDSIDSAVQRLENDTAELERELKYYSPEEQATINDMITHNKETIAKRKEQKLEIIDSDASGKQQSVSRSGANEMRKMIDAAGNNLRTDITRLSNLANQYLVEKQAIASLQENISQREAELAKAK